MAMFCFGESLNVMGTKIGRAMKEWDPEPIKEEAEFQQKQGMDYIDINLGPAKKQGHELMPWIVETVQGVVDLPVLLDTSNTAAIEEGLKVCKKTPIINSIMCRAENYEKMLPMAAKYNADFVALMWGPEGLPRDENERAALSVELVQVANDQGIPNEKIWVDGVIPPVNVQQEHAPTLLGFYDMLQDIAPGAKSTCGLSNISNGIPDHLRPIMNQTYAIMLKRSGMASIITDPKDEMMTQIAKDKRPDIEEVVHNTMDGNQPDMNSLSQELMDYVKTARVLMGFALYSDSWLSL